MTFIYFFMFRPIRTTATAVLYYHRFNDFMNSKEKVINVDGSLSEEDALYQNEEVEIDFNE